MEHNDQKKIDDECSIEKLTKIFNNSDNSYVWLLKTINMNRGRGIEVFQSLEQFEKLINSYYEGFNEITYQQMGNQQKQVIKQKEQIQQGEKQQTINCIKKKENQEKNMQNFESTINDKKVNNKTCLKINNDSQGTLLVNKYLQENTFDKFYKNENNKNNYGLKNIKDKNNDNKNFYLQSSPNSMISLQNNNNKTVNEMQQNHIQSQSNFKLEQVQQEKDNIQQDQHKKQKQNQHFFKSKVKYNSSFFKSNDYNPQKIKRKFNDANQNQNQKPIGKNQGKVHVLKENCFVIQKYLERPFCINQRKFDIRVWSLVTQNYDVYVFQEGYLRTSSEKYDLENIENPFIHLTNNAVQKYSKNYGIEEFGNQLSFQQFQNYLDQTINHNEKYKMLKGEKFEEIKVEQLKEKMNELIKISFESVKQKINRNERQFCFEIFGFDFIIDENFQVWLIEVNTNPCLETSSKILSQYIPRMLDDCFKLTIDKVFKPKSQENIQYISMKNKENNLKVFSQNENYIDNQCKIQNDRYNQQFQQQKTQNLINIYSQQSQPQNTYNCKQDKEVNKDKLQKQLQKYQEKLQNQQGDQKTQDKEEAKNQNQISQFQVDGYGNQNMWNFLFNMQPQFKI